MGRRLVAVFGTMARCSGSTPIARVLTPGIGLRQPLVFLLLTATELFRMPDWLYRATPCMARRTRAAVLDMARCSPSTSMARVLLPCIVSLAAATELIRLGDY